MRLVLSFMLLAIACTPQLADVPPDGTTTLALSATPTPPVVMLSRLERGGIASIYINGAPPGAHIEGAIAAGRGRNACLVLLEGRCTDLVPPYLAAEGTVNEDGFGVIEVTLPAGIPRGMRLYAQLAGSVDGRSATSHLMSGSVHDPAPPPDTGGLFDSGLFGGGGGGFPDTDGSDTDPPVDTDPTDTASVDTGAVDTDPVDTDPMDSAPPVDTGAPADTFVPADSAPPTDTGAPMDTAPPVPD